MVNDNGRGTSKAARTSVHSTQSRISATTRVAPLHGRSAAANAGPAVTGWLTHTARNTHTFIGRFRSLRRVDQERSYTTKHMSASRHGGVLPMGLATGIGSLPCHDPAAAAEFVLRVHPDLPAVPQLAVPTEGVVSQWAGALPEVTVARRRCLARRPGPGLRGDRHRVRSHPSRRSARLPRCRERQPRTRRRASRRRLSVRSR